jgi:hypothetical protein
MAKKPSEGSQAAQGAKSPFEKLRTTGSSAYRLFVLARLLRPREETPV